jgi:hypothetical protein
MRFPDSHAIILHCQMNPVVDKPNRHIDLCSLRVANYIRERFLHNAIQPPLIGLGPVAVYKRNADLKRVNTSMD